VTYSPRTLMQKVQSFCADSGHFDGEVRIGDFQAPPSLMSASVYFDGFRVTETSLISGSGIVDIRLRLWRGAMAEPKEDEELEFAETCFLLLEKFAADFTFQDANARNLVPLDTRVEITDFEYQTGLYAVADITLPILVNDVVTWSTT
jgi:hypothetical protein